MAAAIQRFVGDKPVDSFPPEAISQIPDEVLRKREAERLSKGEHKGPGAGRRAGAATRNPGDYDTKGGGRHGNRVPMADPVI